jgi:hypothetical protein
MGNIIIIVLFSHISYLKKALWVSGVSLKLCPFVEVANKHSWVPWRPNVESQNRSINLWHAYEQKNPYFQPTPLVF